MQAKGRNIAVLAGLPVTTSKFMTSCLNNTQQSNESILSMFQAVTMQYIMAVFQKP